MSEPPKPRLRRRHWSEVGLRARTDQRGSTAVEFALIAPAFLGLIFSIMEVGWFYFMNSQVDAATTEAARLIRTGQAQKNNLTKEQFFSEVCRRIVVLGDCSNKLTVDVQIFPTFAALAADSSTIACADDATAVVQALPYRPGVDNDVVRVRICVLYKTINPLIGVNVSDRSNGNRRLYGAYLSRNEPFSRNAN